MSMIMPVLYLLAAVDGSPDLQNLETNFKICLSTSNSSFVTFGFHSNVWRCLKTEEERQGRHMCTITCGGVWLILSPGGGDLDFVFSVTFFLFFIQVFGKL